MLLRQKMSGRSMLKGGDFAPAAKANFRGREMPRFYRMLLSAILLLAAGVQANAAPLPPIRHVFIIMLENESAATTFGRHSPAPYLAHTLPKMGAYLRNYYATGHFSLDNYISLISGQGPNHVTQSDCQTFVDFTPDAKLDADGQAIGEGCVYPAGVKTIADQLSAAGLAWKSYAEDMGNDPARESATCGHPPVGAADPTQKATPKDQYATRHNPFMYFHSIIDTPACSTNAVNLAALETDLKSADTTPNLAFIVPNLCHDGHDGDGTGKRTCVNGEPGGLVSADAFLKQWVPAILASPAFRQDGLLIVTFDEAEIDIHPDAKDHGDASACCGEPHGPNITSDQTVFGVPDQGPGVIGPGGGRIGAVLISRYIPPGRISRTPYNHYSLLRTLEDVFGLPHLGYAARPGLKSLGADVFGRGR